MEKEARRTFTQAYNNEIDKAYEAGDTEKLDAFLHSKAEQFAKYNQDAVDYIMERLPKRLEAYNPDRIGKSGQTAKVSTFVTTVMGRLATDWWRKTHLGKISFDSDEVESETVGSYDRRRNGRRELGLGEGYYEDDRVIDWSDTGWGDKLQDSGTRYERVEPESDRESQHLWWKQMLKVRETGASVEQMAELMDVKPSAVRATLSRWRRKLQEAT